MSYGRDRDALTRGVGAIAARDHGNTRALARRNIRARASRARDRYLSQFTYGPGGGMGATMVDDKNPRPDAPGTGSNPVPDPGGGSGPVTTGRFSKYLSQPAAGGVFVKPPNPVIPPKGTTTGGTWVTQGKFTQMPGVIVDPVRGTLSPAAPSGGSFTSGGGGGGGGTFTATPPSTLPPLPEDEPIVDPSDPVVTPKRLLIGAAVAAGALYLLLRKKRKAAP